VDRHVLVDDAAREALHRIGALVLLHPVDALYDDVFDARAPQHGAALALVAAGDHYDFVSFADSLHGGFLQSTSGASDTIFMKRSVRSSRVTGPKMRVPIGSSFGVSSTTALESNRTSEPSARRTPFAVAHHHGVVDLALLYTAARRRVLDADLDHIADRGVAALRAAEHLDAHHGARTGIVGDVENRLHLDH
jgi:hypothetical protein